MNDDFSLESLVVEVERYLVAVDTFRALECEPTWRPEPSPVVTLVGLQLGRDPRESVASLDSAA